ncbi:hypothetical protein GCM10010923_08260 [Blastomonas marina]|uniref:ATP-binding protein n=1 Tax=Blastomonas marina TaxID=1867408 RepID=A0ABQ1F6X7_9SPHN|nr:ATP-binding protein [Blastomonas marina]GGA01899.1 hypothetical protein GCM10010923_08260 [Blastomonas marina]
MAETIEAKANPEKRLFISLLTRDIPLADAFLDLVDNSINSVLANFSKDLSSAAGYVKVLEGKISRPPAKIDIQIDGNEVKISDDSTGISFTSARDHVFQFGRASNERHPDDRLSVYGVGLKRAIFKIGNHIKINSKHAEGGFSTDLHVDKWESDKRNPWVIDIEKGKKAPASTGTTISIKDLYPEVKRRISDGLFIGELIRKMQRAYEFFLKKVVRIFVNKQEIEPFGLSVGENVSSDTFEMDGVSCNIVAGVGTPDARGFFVDDKAGWTIFCNGRALLFADKSALTGWSGSPELPLFQPKHRPFVGFVFFVASDPEKLPWTTTKGAINRESEVWQEARKKMVSVGRQVTGFLDRRYDNEGTKVSRSEVATISGSSTTALKMSLSKKTEFKIPQKKGPETIRIQYDAELEKVDAIREYLGKRRMSGSDVGRRTFEYFLKNRVGYDA